MKSQTKTNSNQSWPITYRWAAMGTIIAYSAIGSKAIHAEEMPKPSGAISQTQARHFDVAPGPLSEVLAQFASAAGITYTLSIDSIGTINSPGVSGTFTVKDG